MKTNITITGLYKHFLLDREEIEEKNDINGENNKYFTKIKQHNFSSINEANICHIIKKIPYYSNNYLIIEDYDFINIGEINEKIITKYENYEKTSHNNYLLLKYKNSKYIHFNDFLFNLIKPKMLIFHVIESFSHLLQSLIQLNENDICFFDLSYENIVFDLDSREKPKLCNFNSSLLISKLNQAYITNIIKNIKDYSLKPLEFHVLFYLIENDITTISITFIEEVCEIFLKNMSILDLFSENYRNSYKILCVESLKKYINKPKNDIIEDILSYGTKWEGTKWEVYSFSLLFLHIFGNISRVFSLKGTFISKISIVLLKNIHPDPSKRGDLQELHHTYNKLFNDEKDWSYVNQLDNRKLTQLFDILDK